MPEQSMLVVDDEQHLRAFVRRNLAVRGYRVETAANGLEALAQLERMPFDLIILDLMMPHMDGLETTRRIRQRSLVPIIILSALGEERDKVNAFEMGADDYLTKPFGVAELLARVQAVLRRSHWSLSNNHAGQERIHRGDIQLDAQTHTVLAAGKPIDLTPIEFNLLYHLMEQAGKVLSHRDLLQCVWGPEYGAEVEYLRVYIGRLRRKLEADPSQPRYLLTEHGLGYRFSGV
jgi:two-component system KDP operon response regulator KdpE